MTRDQLSELKSAGAEFDDCDLGSCVQFEIDGMGLFSLVLRSEIKVVTMTGLKEMSYYPFGCKMLPLLSSKIKKLEGDNIESAYALIKLSILDKISRISSPSDAVTLVSDSITNCKDIDELMYMIKDLLHTLLSNQLLDTSIISQRLDLFDSYGISINDRGSHDNDTAIIFTGEHNLGSRYDRVYVLGASKVTVCKCNDLYAYDGSSVSAFGANDVFAGGCSEVTVHYSTDVKTEDKARVNLTGGVLNITTNDRSRVIVKKISTENVKINDNSKVIELSIYD